MKLKDADKIISQCEEYANLLKYDGSTEREWATVKRIMQIINEAPTIEPDTDTISRQAVIITVDAMRKKCDTDNIDDYRDLLVEAIEVLPPSPSRPQWIPCSNQLPEVTVLCCDTRGEMIIGYLYQDEESNTGYSAVLDDVVMIDCIAWMPLPEPYAERRTDG